jgi:integrase
MKTSILARVDRVAENLYRDPSSGNYYGIKKVNRRRKIRSFKVSDRATANGKLKSWLMDLAAGDHSVATETLKFEALLQSFLAIRSGKAPKTVGTENGLGNVLRKGFERGMGVAVRQIRTSDLLKWLNDETKTRKWSAETYNRARYFLRQLFDIAVADGIVTEATNPFRPKLIPRRKCEPVRRNIPTVEQFETIVRNVRSQRDNPSCEESADFLAFQGLLGVGQAEAASVRRSDINGEKINFVRQKTKRAFSVPIYEWARELIEKLRAQPVRMNEKLFSIRDAKKAITHACKRLGYPRFTQRNLRAMCIKRLYDAGVPVKRIALWQGHNDGGKLILQIYTEVFCDTDAAAEAADLALVTSAKVVKFAA